MTISTTALEVPEGETGRYTVVLDTEPTADVTVAIQVPETQKSRWIKTTLTFTAAHWNTPQTVAVTAAQDDDAVADDPVTLTHAVSGGDYEGVATADVEVSIIEDDTAGVTISITALEVPEGETGHYTVVLDTEPTADVTVAIQVPDNADITVGQAELTFTAAHWNTPQTVAVTAAQDDDAVADDPVTLTHAVSGGDYEGVATAEVEVTIIEDDTPGVSVSETTLTITEGDAKSYAIVLDTEPAADVIVAIQVPENADIAVDQDDADLHGGPLEYTADSRGHRRPRRRRRRRRSGDDYARRQRRRLRRRGDSRGRSFDYRRRHCRGDDLNHRARSPRRRCQKLHRSADFAADSGRDRRNTGARQRGNRSQDDADLHGGPLEYTADSRGHRRPRRRRRRRRSGDD